MINKPFTYIILICKKVLLKTRRDWRNGCVFCKTERTSRARHIGGPPADRGRPPDPCQKESGWSRHGTASRTNLPKRWRPAVSLSGTSRNKLPRPARRAPPKPSRQLGFAGGPSLHPPCPPDLRRPASSRASRRLFWAEKSSALFHILSFAKLLALSTLFPLHAFLSLQAFCRPPLS